MYITFLFLGYSKTIKVQSMKHRANQRLRNSNTKQKTYVMRKSRSTPLTKLEYIYATCKPKLPLVHVKKCLYTNKRNKNHRIKKIKTFSDCRFGNSPYLNRKTFPKINIDMQREERAKNYYKHKRNAPVCQHSMVWQINNSFKSIRKAKERDKDLRDLTQCKVTETQFMLTDRDNSDQEISEQRKLRNYPLINTVRTKSSFNPEFKKTESPAEVTLKADKDEIGNSFFKCCNFFFCHHKWNKIERRSKTKSRRIKKSTEQTNKNGTNIKLTFTKSIMAVDDIEPSKIVEDSRLKPKIQHNKKSFLHRYFQSISRKDKQKPFKDKVITKYKKHKKTEIGRKSKIVKLCFRFCTGKEDRIKVKKSQLVTSLKLPTKQKKSSLIKTPIVQKPSSTRLGKSLLQQISFAKNTANNENITEKTTSGTTLTKLEILPKNGMLNETFQVESMFRLGFKLSEPRVFHMASTFKLIFKFTKDILFFFTTNKKKTTKQHKYINLKAKSAKNLKKTEERGIKIKSTMQKKSSNISQNPCNLILSKNKISTSHGQFAKSDSKTCTTKSQTDIMKASDENGINSTPKKTKCQKKTNTKREYFSETRRLQKYTKSKPHTLTAKSQIYDTTPKIKIEQNVNFVFYEFGSSLQDLNKCLVRKQKCKICTQRNIECRMIKSQDTAIIAETSVEKNRTSIKHNINTKNSLKYGNKKTMPKKQLRETHRSRINTRKQKASTTVNSEMNIIKNQTDFIKKERTVTYDEADGRNVKITRTVSKLNSPKNFSNKNLCSNHRQKNHWQKSRLGNTLNLNTQYKQKVKPCAQPGSCVPGLHDPRDSLKRIETTQPHKLIPTRRKRKQRVSQTDVLKTKRLGSQSQTDGRNNKYIRTVSKQTNRKSIFLRHVSSNYRHKKLSIKRRHNMPYLNTIYKHKHKPCELGSCVPGECNRYDRSKRFINKKLGALTLIKSKTKVEVCPTNITSTERMTTQSQIEVRNNKYTRTVSKQSNQKNVSKRYLSLKHSQNNHSEKIRCNMPSLNIKYKQKLKPFKCEPGSCVPRVCALFDCLKRITIKTFCAFIFLNTKTEEKESQTEVTKIKRKAIQDRTNIKKFKSKKNNLKQLNCENEFKRYLCKTCRQKIKNITRKNENTYPKQSIQEIISKKQTLENQKRWTKISQTIMKNAKIYSEYSTKTTDHTAPLKKTDKTQNCKEKRRNNIKIVNYKNIRSLDLETNLTCHSNCCIPNQCNPFICVKRIAHKATNRFTPNKVKESQGNIQLTDYNITKNANTCPKQTAEKFESKKQLSKIEISESKKKNQKPYKQVLILKINGNKRESGLCIPVIFDTFTCSERNQQRRPHLRGKYDLRKKQSHAKVTMTTKKATNSPTCIQIIQNTKTTPKQSTNEIVSNSNKLNTEHRPQRNVNNQNDMPYLKEQHRIESIEINRKTDTRTYSILITYPKSIKSCNGVTNLKYNIPKQLPHKCKSDFSVDYTKSMDLIVPKQWDLVWLEIKKCNFVSDKPIKTSKYDNSDYAVVCSREEKNDIFNHGIVHKENHVDISTHSDEINRNTKHKNNNKNKKPKSDNDFMKVRKPKPTPYIFTSKHKKTNTQKPRIMSSTIMRDHTSTHLRSKQKSNSSKTTLVDRENISKKVKLNETFQVASTFKCGIKFSDHQTHLVRSNFKLNFKFKRHILSSFISDKKKSDIEIFPELLIKKNNSNITQNIRTPDQQKRNKVRSLYTSTHKNISQSKCDRNEPKNHQQFFYHDQRDIKIPKNKQTNIRNQASSTQNFNAVPNRDYKRTYSKTNKITIRTENLKKSKEECRTQKSYVCSNTDTSMNWKKKSYGSPTALCRHLPSSCDRCSSTTQISYGSQTHLSEISTRHCDPFTCLKLPNTNANIKDFSETVATNIPKEITQTKQIFFTSDAYNCKNIKNMKLQFINTSMMSSHSYCLKKRSHLCKYFPDKPDVRRVCVIHYPLSSNHQSHVFLKYKSKEAQVMALRWYESELQLYLSKRYEPLKYPKGYHIIYADVLASNQSEICNKNVDDSCLIIKNKSITILKPYKCKLDICKIKQCNSTEIVKRNETRDLITNSKLNVRKKSKRKPKRRPNKIQRRHRNIKHYICIKTQIFAINRKGCERKYCVSRKCKIYKYFKIDKKNTSTLGKIESSKITYRTKTTQSKSKQLKYISINDECELSHFDIPNQYNLYLQHNINQRKEKRSNILKKNVKVQLTNTRRQQRTRRRHHNYVADIRSMKIQISKLEPYIHELGFSKFELCHSYSFYEVKNEESKKFKKWLYKYNSHLCKLTQWSQYQCRKTIKKIPMNKQFEQSIRKSKTKHQPIEINIHKILKKNRRVLVRSEFILTEPLKVLISLHKSSKRNKLDCTKKLLTKANLLCERRTVRRSQSCQEFCILGKCNPYKHLLKIRKRDTHSYSKFPKLYTGCAKASYKSSEIKQTPDNPKPYEWNIYFYVLEKCSPYNHQKQKNEKNVHTMPSLALNENNIINKKCRSDNHFCEIYPYERILKYNGQFNCFVLTQNKYNKTRSQLMVKKNSTTKYFNKIITPNYCVPQEYGQFEYLKEIQKKHAYMFAISNTKINNPKAIGHDRNLTREKILNTRAINYECPSYSSALNIYNSNPITSKNKSKSIETYRSPSQSKLHKGVIKIYEDYCHTYKKKFRQQYKYEQDKFTDFKRYEKNRAQIFMQSDSLKNYTKNKRDNENVAYQRIPTVTIKSYYENKLHLVTPPKPFNFEITDIKIINKQIISKLRPKSNSDELCDFNMADQIDSYKWVTRVKNRHTSMFESETDIKINKSDMKKVLYQIKEKTQLMPCKRKTNLGLRKQREGQQNIADGNTRQNLSQSYAKLLKNKRRVGRSQCSFSPGTESTTTGIIRQKEKYAAINYCDRNHFKKLKVERIQNKITDDDANKTFPFGNQNVVVSYANQNYFYAMPIRLRNKFGLHHDSNRNMKKRKRNKDTDSEELNCLDQSLKVTYSNSTAQDKTSLFIRFKERFACTLRTVRKIFASRNQNFTNVSPKQCTSACAKQNIICRTRRRSVQCLHPCTSKTCIIERQVQKAGVFIIEAPRRKNKNQDDSIKIIMPYSPKKFLKYVSDLKIEKRRNSFLLTCLRIRLRTNRDKASQVIHYYNDSGTDARLKSSDKKL